MSSAGECALKKRFKIRVERPLTIKIEKFHIVIMEHIMLLSKRKW